MTRHHGKLFVFVYMNSCQYCPNLFPIFEHVQNDNPSINFGLLNASENMALIEQTQATDTSISFVPMFILFNHNKIVGHFLPDDSPPQTIAAKMNQFLSKTVMDGETSSIPAYSIGIPGNLTGRCSIFDDQVYR